MPFSTPNYLCNQNRGNSTIFCMHLSLSAFAFSFVRRALPHQCIKQSIDSLPLKVLWIFQNIHSTHTHIGHFERFELKIQSQRCLYKLLETVYVCSVLPEVSPTLCRFVSSSSSLYFWVSTSNGCRLISVYEQILDSVHCFVDCVARTIFFSLIFCGNILCGNRQRIECQFWVKWKMSS